MHTCHWHLFVSLWQQTEPWIVNLKKNRNAHSDECPCGTGPQPPTISCSSAPPSTLWDVRHGPVRGRPQEALGTRWDTAADCGLRLTYQTEDLAWPGTHKKKNRNGSHTTRKTGGFGNKSPPHVILTVSMFCWKRCQLGSMTSNIM